MYVLPFYNHSLHFLVKTERQAATKSFLQCSHLYTDIRKTYNTIVFKADIIK